jgi:hypothetical protein
MPVRPASVSKPLKIYEIKLDRAAIDQMPLDARRNLFLFGHIGNEINTLNRLVTFSIKKRDNPIEAMFGGARAATILRTLIGITVEGYRELDKMLRSDAFENDYKPRLKSEGIEALARVNVQRDKIELIKRLRDKYAFHLPNRTQLGQAYGKLPIDVDLHIFSGTTRHSSLYEMSHTLMLCGMLELVPDSHAMTDEAAMDVIVADAISKSVDLNDFIEHLLIVFVEQHDLAPEPIREVASIDSQESVTTFGIPPLLRD